MPLTDPLTVLLGFGVAAGSDVEGPGADGAVGDTAVDADADGEGEAAIEPDGAALVLGLAPSALDVVVVEGILRAALDGQDAMKNRLVNREIDHVADDPLLDKLAALKVSLWRGV